MGMSIRHPAKSLPSKFTKYRYNDRSGGTDYAACALANILDSTFRSSTPIRLMSQGVQCRVPGQFGDHSLAAAGFASGRESQGRSMCATMGSGLLGGVVRAGIMEEAA